MQELTVSNSSPIIHLAKVDQLDLLRDFFGELLIPEAVYGLGHLASIAEIFNL